MSWVIPQHSCDTKAKEVNLSNLAIRPGIERCPDIPMSLGSTAITAAPHTGNQGRRRQCWLVFVATSQELFELPGLAGHTLDTGWDGMNQGPNHLDF